MFLSDWFRRRIGTPPRRRGRIALCAGALACLLAAAYMTLPWWAPKAFLQKRFAEALSRQLDLPVSIERLDMSWQEGIVLTGLRIGERPEFGPQDMVSVGSLRCDLSPIRLAATGRLKWVEIDDARLHVVVKSNRQVNLWSLQGLSREGSSPPQLLVVRRAAVTLQLPDHDRELRLDVSHLQYRAGRLESLGQVTMSAALAQHGPVAPVSLNAAAGGGDGPSAASCKFHFSQVDLDQLNLPAPFHLPLTRLAGEASGDLDCRLNQEGVVDQFILDINVKNLDVHPLNDLRLPVFKDAQIHLEAKYDLLGYLEVKSIRLRLPGINLEKGLASLASLDWRGIQKLELSGTLNPTILSALTNAPLPGGVEIDGDVDFDVQMKEEDNELQSHLVADASAATVRIEGRPAKPAGRALSGDLYASLSKQTWDFATDSAELRLGGNRFTGSGAIQKVRDVVNHWLQAGESATLGVLLDDLAGLNWSGAWEIRELESLRDLAGPIWPTGPRLTGQIQGQWSLEHGEAVLFHGSLSAPAGTELSLGPWFVKPAPAVLRGELTAEVDTQTPGLKNVKVWAGVGDSAASVEDMRVSFVLAPGSSGEPELSVMADGTFHVHDAGGLLRCVPAAGAWPGRLSGELSGRFDLMRSASFRRVHLQADATSLALAAGEDFEKSAGQPAEFMLDYAAGAGAGEAGDRLALSARLGAERFDGVVILPPAGPADEPLWGEARVRVTDAGWLLARCPRLQRRLKDCDVRGALTLSARGQVGADQMQGEVRLDADDLSFRLPATGGIKPRGAPLRLRLSGRLAPDEIELKLLAADVGQSSLSAEGKVRLGADAGAAPGGEGGFRRWPPPHVESVDLKLRGRAGVDPVSWSLLPELARQLKRLGVGGAVEFWTDVRGGADAIELKGGFDAAALTLERKDVRKESGWRADGSFDVLVPADLAYVHVRDLFLDGGDFQLRADAKIPLLKDGDPETHVALHVADFERLGQRTPALAPYALTGGLLLESELSLRKGRAAVKYATLTADNLAGRLGGKNCRLNGRATIEELSFGPGGPIAVGRVATDELEFAAGDSQGFIVADLTEPLTAPKGRVELLCSKLDIYDLAQWGPPAGAATAPSPVLSPPEKEALTKQGQAVVAAMRKLIVPAAATLRLQADRLKYYDGEVKAMYEIRGVVADFDLHDGVLKAGYRCALSGGEMFQNYLADFRPEDVRLGIRGGMREIISSEAILAQLAKEFPGNTVYGTFSRSHDLSYSLRDVVMNMIDSRYYPPATGDSVTITEDGLIRGRAAPRFISGIFPGLNLTTYRYRRMTGFTRYDPDGRRSSDLIFSGYNYDLYIEGHTDVDRRGTFEIGVILVGSPQSAEFNHRLRPGRVPVLNFRARIEDGQFKDEEVWFKLPTETAYVIFLKNNLLYRIWLTAVSQGGAKAVTNGPGPPPAPVK